MGARPLGAGWGHGDSAVSLPPQPLSRNQALNRSRSSINMRNFRKFNARRKWKVNGCPAVGSHHPRVPWGAQAGLHPKAGSISGMAVVLWWGGRAGEGPSPQTPSPGVPQLSYNTVSACNRLCRTRLLCDLGKEDEELVSPQEPPDPTQHGLGRGRRDLGCLSQFPPMAVPSMLQAPCFGQEGQSVGPPCCWDGMREVWWGAWPETGASDRVGCCAVAVR